MSKGRHTSKIHKTSYLALTVRHPVYLASLLAFCLVLKQQVCAQTEPVPDISPAQCVFHFSLCISRV